MKILICVAKIELVKKVLNLTNTSIPFIFTSTFLTHEITVCETGMGGFQTSYKITKSLATERFHLALKIGFCNSLEAELNVGSVVNVIKEKAGDIGEMQHENWQDLYDLKWIETDSFPHFKGSFINMNNSYMNIMLDFKKVVGVTVNELGCTERLSTYKEKYKAQVESMDGLGFVYACMSEHQPFYQILIVERNLINQDSNPTLAKETLIQTLLKLIEKL